MMVGPTRAAVLLQEAKAAPSAAAADLEGQLPGIDTAHGIIAGVQKPTWVLRFDSSQTRRHE
jgi:hypothetical protein